MEEGQTSCFPLEKFNMDYLPPLYRTDDIMKCIKLMSDLTVRVLVKHVSNERPETVPGTYIPYPWSSHKGSNMERIGTGWIDNAAVLDTADCCCKECKNSPKPKPKLAYINIVTAAHLVCDQLEAEHAICQLVIDSGDAADVDKEVVTLTIMIYCCVDTFHDTCRIMYATHNCDLVRSLEKTKIHFTEALYSLTQNAVKSTGQHVAKHDNALHIMISHYLGYSKYVSFGYCGNRGDADSEKSQFPETVRYCPGSSGAPVISLGRHFVYPCYV